MKPDTANIQQQKHIPPRENVSQIAPLHPIQVKGAFHWVAMDIIGPMTETARGNKYIIIFIDYLTKWVEARPLPNQTAPVVAKAFIEDVVCRHGIPETILSDRGPQFMGSVFTRLCALLNIDKTCTSGYRPQTDGLCERFNKTLATMLSCYCNENTSDWDEYIATALFSYRCATLGPRFN